MTSATCRLKFDRPDFHSSSRDALVRAKKWTTGKMGEHLRVLCRFFLHRTRRTSCVPIWCAPWPDSILGGQPRHQRTRQKCMQIVGVAAWSKRRSSTIQRPFLGRRTVPKYQPVDCRSFHKFMLPYQICNSKYLYL